MYPRPTQAYTGYSITRSQRCIERFLMMRSHEYNPQPEQFHRMRDGTNSNKTGRCSCVDLDPETIILTLDMKKPSNSHY